MRKLSFLMALMLVMTVGGVYAVWTYAGTNDIADAFDETSVTITDVQLVGANGTYTIESNLVLTIDQAAPNDHTAVLVYGATDDQPIHLTVTFRPAAHASVDIKQNAVPTELYFTTTSVMEFPIDAEGHYDADAVTPTKILKFKNEKDNNFSANIVWGDAKTDAQGTYFEYKLDEAALKQWVQLNTTFVLDTQVAHEAFREALTGAITARVTDGVNIAS